MRAYILTERGPELGEAPEPQPGPADVLVRVRACALNRVDLAMARGHVHGRAGGPGQVLGVECAGEVVALGADVPGLELGDRVMCSGSGAFAEYACVDWGRALRLDGPALSDHDAAALPVALQTMHDAVFTHGQLQAGQSVLVQGASSGVGLMALQLAKLRGASVVIGSSTDPDRRARLAELGADLAIDSRDPEWVEAVRAATSGAGVDVLIDQISGPLLNANLRATRIGGRIVNVGRLGGERAELDCDLHALRRITYVGVTFRTRSRAEVRAIRERLQADLRPWLDAGRLRLPIDRVLPFADLPAGLQRMRENRHFGKIVLEVGGG